MTTTAAAPPVPPPPGVAPKPKRSRRWLRAALPFVVLVALIAGTVTARQLEELDPAEPSYLSPASTGGDGAATLADRLRARGVAVDRFTDVPGALAAARQPGTTLFVTTPAMLRPESVGVARELPPTSRVVLVAPGATVLAKGGVPVRMVDERWAVDVRRPGCAEPVAAAAGPAAVRRQSYVGGALAFSCYRGGLVETAGARAPVTVVGAADVFRNDRIAEHGNAALAVGLLDRGTRVVWVDVHEREVPPFVGDGPGSGSEQQQRPVDTGAPTPGPGPGGDGGATAESEDDVPLPSATPPSLLDAFPPALWATLLLLLLAVVGFVLASARRLGPPVPEPLPVRVRATETVHGRGALYRRAGARGPSLDVLRGAARQRLGELLRLPPHLGTDELVDAVAAHTGRDPEQIRLLFTGPDPHQGEADDDARFVADAVTLQHIVDEVAGRAPRPDVPREGDPW